MAKRDKVAGMEKTRGEENAERGEGAAGRGARRDWGGGRDPVIGKRARQSAPSSRCWSRVGGTKGVPPCLPDTLGREAGRLEIGWGVRRGGG